MILFAADFYANLSNFHNCYRIFGLAEVFEIYRLLYTVLFLTDSVFVVLIAYFDETMVSIGGYDPWKSENTVI